MSIGLLVYKCGHGDAQECGHGDAHENMSFITKKLGLSVRLAIRECSA